MAVAGEGKRISAMRAAAAATAQARIRLMAAAAESNGSVPRCGEQTVEVVHVLTPRSHLATLCKKVMKGGFWFWLKIRKPPLSLSDWSTRMPQLDLYTSHNI